MTPDERQLISGLFDRMRQNGPVAKDREAESLINQAVRQTPDAAYLLVQSVLAQEHYLQEAAGRIEDLEARLRDVEDQLQAQQSQPQRSSGGSFLGGLFGGSKPAPQPQARASVPSFGSRAQPGQAGSPWGSAAGSQPQQGGFGYGQQPMQQAQPQGGGFMRSALTTAAGVAGGMMAASAIQGMLGGGSSANAAGHPSSTPAASDSSPFAVDSAADRQRELDAQQDAQQDQEMESEQAFFDDSSSDDSEY